MRTSIAMSYDEYCEYMGYIPYDEWEEMHHNWVNSRVSQHRDDLLKYLQRLNKLSLRARCEGRGELLRSHASEFKNIYKILRKMLIELNKIHELEG